jgi:hypothetical protein
VTCGDCGIDAAAPRLRNRKVAGARFRCEPYGLVFGLPTTGKQRHRPAGSPIKRASGAESPASRELSA